MLAMPQHDDAVIRSLLDQRARRADIPHHHTRYSTFSQASDPSLYSHFNSPDYRTHPTPASRFPPLDDHDFHEHDTNQYPLSPAERLADPNASSLDLSEDTYSERASTILDVDIEDASIHQVTDDDDTETRLSLMGPKMRVHSRAPWEEDDPRISESDLEDGGMDNRSIFGGKKGGFAMMRGLGFGARSPIPRPSFDSATTTKDKRSLESCSSATADSSHGVLHALAQASISSTSLALGPSSSGRFPQGRQNVGRDRAASASASFSDIRSIPPPLPSPHSAAFYEQSILRTNQIPIARRSASPARSEISASALSRTRSPSPDEQDRNGAFVHPYANPALLGSYQRGSTEDHRLNSRKASEREQTPINGSTESSAMSEETVTLSHASTTNLTSMRSGQGTMTPLTSAFSLVSSAQSFREMSPSGDHETEAGKRRVRRDTKLGPISNPTLVSHRDIAASTPVTLISLEQAQAKAKERNRSATSPLPSPIRPAPTTSDQTFSGRLRTSSINATVLAAAGDRSYPASPLPYGVAQQPTPVGSARVIKPKRSGFMKLFNGKEKERSQDLTQHPVPALPTQYGRTDHSYPPPSTPQPKITSHRIPPPLINDSTTSIHSKLDAGIAREDSKTKRLMPQLSIKVTSPQIGNVVSQDSLGSRNSDGSKPRNVDMLKVESHKVPISAPAGTTQFPSLSVRPVSTFFSRGFADHLLSDESSPGSAKNTDTSSIISPTSIASDKSLSPIRAGFNADPDVPDSARSFISRSSYSDSASLTDDNPSIIVAALKERLQNESKKWQRQIWELEGQVRDLKCELEELKAGDKCESCGRGMPRPDRESNSSGVVNRPRAKTGTGARFASGNEI